MQKEKFKGVNSIKFNKDFQTEDECYSYLSDIKWGDKEYACKRCSATDYCKGKQPYSRRCARCGHDESCTVGTSFEKCKFSLLLAFHIISGICKGIYPLKRTIHSWFRSPLRKVQILKNCIYTL